MPESRTARDAGRDNLATGGYFCYAVYDVVTKHPAQNLVAWLGTWHLVLVMVDHHYVSLKGSLFPDKGLCGLAQPLRYCHQIFGRHYADDADLFKAIVRGDRLKRKQTRPIQQIDFKIKPRHRLLPLRLR